MGLVDWLAQRLAASTLRVNARLTQPADDLLRQVQGFSNSQAIAETEAGMARRQVLRVEEFPASDVKELNELHLPQHVLRLLERFSLIEDHRRELRINRGEIESWRLGDSEFIKLGTARGDHALVLIRPGREEVLVFDPSDTPGRLNEEAYPTIFHLLAYVIRSAERS